MTAGAQQALRRTMEIYSTTTRFALACNISSKIIEPIQSRCAILRYTKLSDRELLTRVLEIVEKENVNKTEDGMEAIIFTSEGDMRQAVNNLQSTHVAFGLVDADNVFKVCDQPHPLMAQSILAACVNGDFDAAYCQLDQLWIAGYSPADIVSTLFKVTKNFSCPEYLKLHFLNLIAFTHMKITEGINSLLLLTALLAKMCQKTSKFETLPLPK